jgi:cell fate regulator YaaT (PSP1 superfamily)
MLPPDRTEVDNVYEIRFKNTRKDFYRNVNGLRLYAGDLVVVESDRGFDVGEISLGGVMAELQMKKKGVKKKREDLSRIYRRANEVDEALIKELRRKEPELVARARVIIRELKLDMKLSDIEYQGDGTKAIFYYIADHRVDFRELIKLLAREFHIRIEMKQIGLRHEAGLIGGIGACGRELCCSTWLTHFKTVSTSAARYQNLSLNPMKISGLCGRLKCCLNYELESYMDALKGFPKIDKLKTGKGTAMLQKTDIFKGIMWFSYPDETSWYPLEVEEVRRLKEQSEKGEAAESLGAFVEAKNKAELEKSFDFVDVVGTELPDLPDRSNQKRRRKKKKKPRGRGPQSSNRGQGSNPSGNQPKKSGEGQQSSSQEGGKPSSRSRRKPRSKQRPKGNAPQSSGGPKQEGPSDSNKPKRSGGGKGRGRGRRGGRGGRGRGNKPSSNSPSSSSE